jgi:antitoxin MazE
MKVKVEKHGGELVLRIPEQLAESTGLGKDEEVEIRAVGATLVVWSGSRPSLEDLLEQVTEENLHGEWETGPPVGREIW